ncbi:hypothetical protein C5167_024901 [Papaver somniferum]|uniref:Defective in cullin neddylation protein n=1 Tax=Papaver somniferum TaxID=3469 RepID=A0A4Y7JTX6_PAPSO|nr:hypothetical protein C5167_024901 [Papaver somniferum]
MLAWKMSAAKMGYFTRDECRNGLAALEAKNGQRDVEKESICELLDMLLGSWYPAQVGKLVEYLKFQTDYKVICKDQWMGFYRFCTKVSFPDMTNYDADNGFYSLIIDNFVDWMKEGKN